MHKLRRIVPCGVSETGGVLGFPPSRQRRFHAEGKKILPGIPVLSFPHAPIVRLTYGAEFLKVEIMSFTLHLSNTLPAAGALSIAALLLRA